MKTNILKSYLAILVFIGTTTFLHAQQTATIVEGVRLAPMSNNSLGSSTFAGNANKNYNEADLKSKEISKELNAPKNAEIFIENSSRGIIVKTWDQQKVKITTTVYFDGDSKLSDEEWLEKVNLSLKTVGASVKIKSGSVGGSNLYYFNQAAGSYNNSNGGVAVFNGTGENIGTKNNIKRVVTVTVPAGSKLDIESKYADVTLGANTEDLNLDIANGNLEAENINKLVLRSKYSNITVGDVKTAEVELTNGRFNAKNIDDLDIESKYSTIEMALAKKLLIRSTNDEYEIEEVGEINGRKNYGNLRINKLLLSIDIEGNNADVRIRNLSPTVSLIKIDNKYADIRIPLKNTKNYSVDFSGAYSSVYGNFEKKSTVSTGAEEPTISDISLQPTNAIFERSSPSRLSTTNSRTATTSPEAAIAGSDSSHSSAKAAPKKVSGRVISSNNENALSYQRANAMGTLAPLTAIGYGSRFNAFSGSSENPSKFTAIIGDGKGLKISLKCQNCTVDFK